MNEKFSNNFDLLRFLAAGSIIFSHCFALSLGYANVHLFDWHLLVGQFGLATLLVISGYLITKSWEKKPEPRTYFKKRALRLFPGMLTSILFIMFVIGPVNTSYTLREYFLRLADPQTWMAMPFYINGWAIGIFTENPVTYVNAPLWTIPFEFMLYVFVAAFGIMGILWRKRTLLPIIFSTVLLWAVWYDNPALNKIRFAAYFLIGSYLYVNREKIEYKLWLSALLFIPVIVFFKTPFMFVFALIAIPYFVLCIAYLPIGILHKFGVKGDPSYGMYIYSYPIQQTILHFIPAIAVGQLIGLTFAAVIPMAYASWHLIEKKALSMK
ncbi:acyltransferase family protein [Methanoplanus endosymbiosus]|uniref:Acyltransferase n=1 Tax=Methanoplanus endosymbiosus TaxID=33865 RepID=A0A9E7TKK9_9EURY|nr:acyltransferase [Methanoplanus endosymbiosus]UUX92730.1 acyltransferase [Methanoplanus endosymbiosus]